MILSNAAHSSESLGRYLTQKDHFSRPENTVRPKAFMPPPNLRLSVFRIDGLSFEAVWGIGEREVISAMPQPRTLYGVADIKVSVCQGLCLEVECDDKPTRHADIVGWPGPEEKAKQKILAEELAAEAKLVLK